MGQGMGSRRRRGVDSAHPWAEREPEQVGLEGGVECVRSDAPRGGDFEGHGHNEATRNKKASET